MVTGAELADLEGPARAPARVKGGTLLIDEVGDIDEEVQARIVRMMVVNLLMREVGN